MSERDWDEVLAASVTVFTIIVGSVGVVVCLMWMWSRSHWFTASLSGVIIFSLVAGLLMEKKLRREVDIKHVDSST
jgi:hypothetical protein